MATTRTSELPPDYYIKMDSSIALAMLHEAVNNPAILSFLKEIAGKLKTEVLEKIRAVTEPELAASIFNGLAMQHSEGDRFVGALLPGCKKEFLADQGRSMLLDALKTCLENVDKIKTIEELLSFLKVIDGMGFAHDKLQKKSEQKESSLSVTPTPEESMLRHERKETDQQTYIARTYGIRTAIGEDLIPQNPDSIGIFSGKAKFFAAPTFTKQGKMLQWFPKLVDQSRFQKPSLPLIAGPSSSTARSFVMAHHLELFVSEEKEPVYKEVDTVQLFEMKPKTPKDPKRFVNLNKVQMFGNLMMAYFVYCGHHSFIETTKISDCYLDDLAREYSEQIPPVSAGKKYPEEMLPYSRIGEYRHFLHPTYSARVEERAMQQVEAGLNLQCDNPPLLGSRPSPFK